MNSKTTNTLLVSAIVLVVLLIGVGLWLIFQGTSESSAEPMAAPVSPTPVAEAETAVPTTAPPTATVQEVVVVPPTATPLPTDAPTETPIATDTPVPTETPVPTNTPVPIVYPTATPVPPTAPPPPTNTPGPPPGPQPVTINGLSGTHFALQDRSNIAVNGKIWFEFSVANATGANVPFSTLGVVPRKDGKDRWEFFQKSYGGNNDSIKPSGLNWEDNMYISEAGAYTLRLVICFDDYATCRAGGGTHHTLSPEIPITLN